MDYHNDVKEYMKDTVIADSLNTTGLEISKQMTKTNETMFNVVVCNVPVTIINNFEKPRVRLLAGSLIVDIDDFSTAVKDNLPNDGVSRWNMRNLAILLLVLHNLKEKYGEVKES